MKDKVKIYNAFSVIITTDKEQEELTKAYIDGDWTEMGRILSINIQNDIAQSEANLLETMRRLFGARGTAKTQMLCTYDKKHGDDYD